MSGEANLRGRRRLGVSKGFFQSTGLGPGKGLYGAGWVPLFMGMWSYYYPWLGKSILLGLPGGFTAGGITGADACCAGPAGC